MTEDGKRILAYSYSQPDGSFILECPQGPQQEFLLTTSRLGYEPYRQKIPAQTQQTEILLKESSLSLREVKVISSPIRRQGDTISYYMSNFHRPQDRNLADVLARMPGIHVQSDGRVQYDGKPINRFYIEDMNLLGERYSLATQNLSPSDIAAVQVYENHEPIKMLRDRSQTEQAALNIKLKESARAKWLKTFDFGVGGFPFLYNATGTLARFARKNQTLMIGKINNTGKDIAMELKMHTLKAGQVFRPGAPDGIPDRFSPLSVSSSFFTRDRARFNESSIVSANQL
ncbi:Plug domain-containing protein [Tannerella sp.]|uniref:Plug domain-containing protein n=1 Tax=Tannerella sp. TaxID=2382127 RepID=UPI003FA1FBCD